jgi:hypothetical protein
MKTQFIRFALISTFLVVTAIASPKVLFAQSTPGPMAPATPKEPDPATQPASRPPMPPNTTLTGKWKLNADDSDDGEKKMQQSHSGHGGQGGHGGGGGYPGGGGMHGGGYGGGHESDEGRAEMRELLNPSDTLNLVKKDNELDVTDADNHKLIFYTDNRKVEKSKDTSLQQLPADWKNGDLVSKEKSPRGGKLSRTFELGEEGHQLYETLRIESSRSNTTVVIRYVYDLVPPEKKSADTQ